MAMSKLKKANDMTESETYGVCDICEIWLTARYWTFDRLVQRFDYGQPGDSPESCATVTVLRNDMLSQCCSIDCARFAALAGLVARGLRQAKCGAGPIEVCAKCNAPVDLTKPHVLYQLMGQTELRQPWLTTIEPLDIEYLAYVCPRCDSDLAAYEMNIQESVTEGAPTETKAISSIQTIPVVTDE